MEKIGFQLRLKGKMRKITKNGLFRLDLTNPIEKTNIPESMLHTPLITETISSSNRMDSAYSAKKQAELHSSSYTLIKSKKLPYISVSPVRNHNFYYQNETNKSENKSVSPHFNIRSSQEISKPTQKLPSIYSSNQNMRKAIKSFIKNNNKFSRK